MSCCSKYVVWHERAIVVDEMSLDKEREESRQQEGESDWQERHLGKPREMVFYFKKHIRKGLLCINIRERKGIGKSLV